MGGPWALPHALQFLHMGQERLLSTYGGAATTTGPRVQISGQLGSIGIGSRVGTRSRAGMAAQGHYGLHHHHHHGPSPSVAGPSRTSSAKSSPSRPPSAAAVGPSST
ncbi:hypothetical protein O6H91_Y359700 [Diphasiastrum complanatum]|nr:hypothetical protein O6H91_Y359700 [Diphasiastrum complanatum]